MIPSLPISFFGDLSTSGPRIFSCSPAYETRPSVSPGPFWPVDRRRRSRRVFDPDARLSLSARTGRASGSPALGRRGDLSGRKDVFPARTPFPRVPFFPNWYPPSTKQTSPSQTAHAVAARPRDFSPYEVFLLRRRDPFSLRAMAVVREMCRSSLATESFFFFSVERFSFDYSDSFF